MPKYGKEVAAYAVEIDADDDIVGISNSADNIRHKPTADFLSSSISNESTVERKINEHFSRFYFPLRSMLRIGHELHYKLLQFTTPESGLTQILKEYREFRCSDINISLALFLTLCGLIYMVHKCAYAC